MFGYVTANVKDLSPEELKTYRGLYCGLCRTLMGEARRFKPCLFTYDMTFLILVLSSLYGCSRTLSVRKDAPFTPEKSIHIS